MNSSRISENISFWSPNKIVVSVSFVSNTSSASDILVLNQNYISGWHATVDGTPREVLNVNGLLGVAVDSSDREVVFYYSPLSFWVGMVVTIISIVFLIVLLVLCMKRKKKHEQNALNTT